MDPALCQACFKYIISLCLHKKAKPGKELRSESLGNYPKLDSNPGNPAPGGAGGTASGTALPFVNVFTPLTLQGRVQGQEGGDY